MKAEDQQQLIQEMVELLKAVVGKLSRRQTFVFAMGVLMVVFVVVVLRADLGGASSIVKSGCIVPVLFFLLIATGRYC
jgi:hypothetical protein